MRWIAAVTLLATSLACANVPVPGSTTTTAGGADSLGGVTLGQALDRTGFSCDAARCEKDAEVAGRKGRLRVGVCDGVAYTIQFRGEFLWPDTAAAQLHVPGMADSKAWGAAIGLALQDAGFVVRDPSKEEAEGLREFVGDPQVTAGGHKLEDPEFEIWEHPDGRTRYMLLTEEPASAEAVAIDPNAFLMVAALNTVANKCTSGI